MLLQEQNVLASGSCLQALHLLASHTVPPAMSGQEEWEESKQTNSCITGTQTISVFAATLMPARDPMVQFSQSPWELLGKVEMGYSHSHLNWSAFQPGVTTVCTWIRPGHTLTAWPKSPDRSWFKFAFLSQENLAEPSMSLIRWSSTSLRVRSVSYDVTAGYSGVDLASGSKFFMYISSVW